MLYCDFIARLEYDNKNALLDGVPGATPGSTASTWVGCLEGLEAGVYKVLLLELATDPRDRSPKWKKKKQWFAFGAYDMYQSSIPGPGFVS